MYCRGARPRRPAPAAPPGRARRGVSGAEGERDVDDASTHGVVRLRTRHSGLVWIGLRRHESAAVWTNGERGRDVLERARERRE